MNKKIESLQAGRALAALAVVAHHADQAATNFASQSLPLVHFGWLGVDFFFVLSGFIIAYSVQGKSLDEYAWHRFRRVVIPYLPIGIAIAVLYTLLPGVSVSDRTWDWLPTLTLAPFGDPALSVAWTLQHEMTFYAIFAISWFTRRMWLLGVWGLACLVTNETIVFAKINLEFLMGILSFYAVRAGIGSRLLLLAGLLPVFAWIALGANVAQSPLVGLGIALALPAIVRLESEGMEIPRTFRFLGDASYSIYLAHVVAISVAARVFPNFVFCLLAGIAGGLVYYHAVEKPILRIVTKRLGKQKERLSAENPARR